MKYKEYDIIMLNDGREACIVDISGDTYTVDVGKDEKDWDTISIKECDIKNVIRN